jgi:hypothetical protein
MTPTSKCAHPACLCLVEKRGPYGKYCSEHCKEAAGEIELRCDCQHTVCRIASLPVQPEPVQAESV